jgi:hypothetical protein
MLQPWKNWIAMMIILLAVAACSPQAANTLPPATLTNTPVITVTQTETPTLEPTIMSSPIPSPTATITPISSDLYLPNGIAALVMASGNVVYYDLQGNSLGEIQATQLGLTPYQRAVVTGSLKLSPEILLPSLVYYDINNGGELWVNINNTPSLVGAAPNLLNIISVPAKPTVAFTLLEYMDAGLRSLLYLGDYQGITTTDPILETTTTNSYAIQSLAIATANGQPAGEWYTSVPYGIGGDIVFAPRRSLNYLNLADSQTTNYLDNTKAPIAISDDQTWVAYTPARGVGPITIMHNYDPSTVVTFPLKTDSDRGAGDAVFSSNNQYIAWREASGSIADQPSTFRETVRIGTVDGNIVNEIPDSALLAATGFPDIGWVIPVGWLDTNTLAVEVRAFNVENICILRVNIDGTSISNLATGSFIGFLYP